MSESMTPALPDSPGRRPAGGARPWFVDALVGTVLALALVLIIATSADGHGIDEPGAFAFAVGFGALMLLRRRMPRSVLALSVLGVFAYYTLDYPPIGVALPVIAALFSAAEIGLLGWAIGAGAVVFVVSMFFRLRDGVEAVGYLIGYESVSNIALFAAAITLGYGVRARRIRAAQQAEIVRLTEAQLTRDVESRMRSEREKISRELHDTVGHTMSVIALHAGAGAESVGRDDTAASDAFSRIREASTKSLTELRSMVHILRSDAHDVLGVRSLSAAADLAETARGAGIDVVMDVTTSPDDVSAPVDAAAFRVIQESITNVIRHASASRIEVSARIDDERLHIIVCDNGTGSPADTASGYGHAGMAERVRLLGGSLSVRSGDGGGYTVDATLPTRLSQ